MTTWGMFIFSICASTFSQYWQKKAALLFLSKPQFTWRQKLLSSPIILSFFFLGLAACSWLFVLHMWDVSHAYPLLSINFIAVLILSHFTFNEPITKKQLLGSGFIVVGIILLSGGIE
ncbi:EamA family transporter [uncultured Shewanella sp.]|uniref:EamA family transporter n=1 Tax=uncultured Shewanella sp. TaxID=173975 RepID=UPI00261083E7|nr:EamA family transporter [uncultured Shewanella sp.]